MKQVTILSSIGAIPDLFDEATADIEGFGGINYLIVRRAGEGELKSRELLAAFSSFHSFRIDDTEGSPLLKVAREQLDYLHGVIGEANKEVVERDQTIKEQKHTIELLSMRIKDLNKQLAEPKVEYQIKPASLDDLMPPQLEAPRKPLESLPVAMPPLAEPAPWPKHAERVDSGETVMVPDMPDEAYADDSMPLPPVLKEDEPKCHDSSTKSPHPKGKR